MKKITYLSLLFIAVLFTSCEKTIVKFDSQSVIEFKTIALTVTRGVTSTQASSTGTIIVQLVGPQQSTPITVPYTIDATNSTAVAGTNYTLSTSGTVTIPANSSSAQIVVTGSYANNTASKKLVLILGDGSVAASPNYKTCTVTFSTTVTP
jgi:uncharacterized protein YcfL